MKALALALVVCLVTLAPTVVASHSTCDAWPQTRVCVLDCPSDPNADRPCYVLPGVRDRLEPILP